MFGPARVLRDEATLPKRGEEAADCGRERSATMNSVRPLSYEEAVAAMLELSDADVTVMVGARTGEPAMAMHHRGRVIATMPLRATEPDEELVVLLGRPPGTKLFLERSCFEGAMVRVYETGARKLSLMLGPLEVAISVPAQA